MACHAKRNTIMFYGLVSTPYTHIYKYLHTYQTEALPVFLFLLRYLSVLLSLIFFFFTLIYFVIFVCACARQCAISFASRFICSFSSIRSVFVVLFIDIFIYKSRCLSHSSLTLFHSFTRDSLVTCGWFFSRTVLFLVFLSACNSWHFCLLLLWQHSQHINIV